MALPQSGIITMGQVRTELKKTGSLNLGNIDVRKIAEKPSGTIKMSDLRGKSAEIVYIKNDSFERIEQIPIQPPEALFKLLNKDLKDRNIPIQLTTEEIATLKKGSVYYSEDKIYKIVIVELKVGRVSSMYYEYYYKVDVYKGK